MRSVRVVSRWPVTILVATVAVAARRGVQRLGRSVLAGVETTTTVHGNRRRSIKELLVLIVVGDVGNPGQSNATSLGHLSQSAVRQAIVGPAEFSRVVRCTRRAIVRIARNHRGPNNRLGGANDSHAGLNRFDVGVWRNHPTLI